jgi:hypothetical protein
LLPFPRGRDVPTLLGGRRREEAEHRLHTPTIPLLRQDCVHFIFSLWFKKRFLQDGGFNKPSSVPLDKFKNENIMQYHEYIEIMERLDEVPFPRRKASHQQGCPSSQAKPKLPPWQDKWMLCWRLAARFCEAYNLLAIISANPTKPSSVHCGDWKGKWQLNTIRRLHYATHFLLVRAR